ncbi:MAG: 2TM domain-containing protein [Rhodospirillales bacterium]|nr:2TM domain-containing protein [Rhodospirillales bacterium]
MRAFRWHVGFFVVLNTGFALLNLKIGNTWWAFWPLLASGFLLALHYLGYKSFTLDDAWVDERTQELNLKSYDRSHIEDLKSRHEQK